ncbi:hypothetical protein B0T16DRAFT_453060 [Cercophora newfieldiana]|uniref:Fibroin-3 related protein n=1 Tax=Cercophora newfieldiana TaxID=92897 RepID=A0AA40CZV6_9PEZI|nr:hypothetical protein B0T16DRAFT_453060 [Cercophora newfieldiana]
MAIEEAMRRSVREGFEELLVRSLRPAIERRQDIVGGVSDVKTAFSSWDNCMAATYCKWPVIAIMIIGGLILFSVVWCIIRCACCGLSCCCSCCNFLKCCGNCCGCCDPPRGKRHKYLDEPYIPPNQGYKVQPPMNPHFPPVVPTMTPAAAQFTGVTTVGAASSHTPQYAEFDVSKKGGEDALPAMPSWEGADKKKVYLEEEEVEMDQLKKPEASGQAGAAAAGAVGAAAAVPGGRSPVGSPGLNRSPYGPPAGAPANNGYFPAPGVEADPYASSGQNYNTPGGGYGQPNSMGGNQGYGMAVGAVGAAPGRQSPYNDNGYGNAGYGQQGQGRGYGSPARQDSYNTYGSGRQQGGGAYDNYNQGNQYDNQAIQSYGNQSNQTYGMGPRRSPPNELPAETSYIQPAGTYSQEPSRHSPAPQAGYGNYDNAGYDSRQYSTDSARPLRAPPQRQYTNDTAPQTVQSDAGFDFGTSSYSRPAPGAGGYRQPSPVQPQQQQPTGYPGYKPYSPVNANPPGNNGW